MMSKAVFIDSKSKPAVCAVTESLHAYFETGAQFSDLPGFRLVRAPGLEAMPGGCLIQRADITAAETDPKGWVETCESALSRAGATVYNAFVAGYSPRLDAQMAATGYRKRTHTLFSSIGTPPPSPARVHLHPVTTWPEWNLRCLAERDARRASGIHGGDMLLRDEWLRRKWVTGKLGFFLIEFEGCYVGAVGALFSSRLTRISDVAVRPEWANRGIAESAIHTLWRMALDEGVPEAGAVCRDGEPCHALFHSAGLSPVGAVQEYIRKPGDAMC